MWVVRVSFGMKEAFSPHKESKDGEKQHTREEGSWGTLRLAISVSEKNETEQFGGDSGGHEAEA